MKSTKDLGHFLYQSAQGKSLSLVLKSDNPVIEPPKSLVTRFISPGSKKTPVPISRVKVIFPWLTGHFSIFPSIKFLDFVKMTVKCYTVQDSIGAFQGFLSHVECH